MPASRAPCARASRARGEPLAATASRIDNWLLVEYRGQWARDVLGASRLDEPVKTHLRAQLEALPRSRLLFIRRRVRRAEARLVVYLAVSSERAPSLRRLELAGYEELLDLDLTAEPAGEPVADPLLLVCTHGKRDRCCALYGRLLYDRLRTEPEGEWVWQSSHVGGDRFAGNVLCLPEGLYYGRVEPADVGALLGRYGAGEVWLERYRGRSCYPFAVQAAEHAIRSETGILGIDALRLAACEPSGSGWRVRFRAVATGERYEVEVDEEPGEPGYLTCGAATERPPRRFTAR
jgi:hypothetical protein